MNQPFELRPLSSALFILAHLLIKIFPNADQELNKVLFGPKSAQFNTARALHMDQSIAFSVLFIALENAKRPFPAHNAEHGLSSLHFILVLLQLALVVGIEAIPDLVTGRVVTPGEVHALLDHEGPHTAKLLARDCMPVLMQIQVGFLGKCLSAHCAFVGSLTTVNASVDLHVVFQAEPFAANIALVRFFTSVSDAMPTEFTGIGAHYVAASEVTWEETRCWRLLRVHSLHVPFQTRRVKEVLIAHCALSRLGSCRLLLSILLFDLLLFLQLLLLSFDLAFSLSSCFFFGFDLPLFLRK